jgi:hypothetical protein
LLGLLLAALEKWKAAKDALEEGLEIAEEYSSGDEVDPTQNGIRIKDFGAMNGYTEGLSRRDSGGSLKSIRLLLDEDATEVAPAATLLRPVLDQPPPSRQDIFEQSLQLRMTQVVLAECVEGPEGASDRWVEVFGWIAEKRGVIAEQRELSPALWCFLKLLTMPKT